MIKKLEINARLDVVIRWLE